MMSVMMVMMVMTVLDFLVMHVAMLLVTFLALLFKLQGHVIYSVFAEFFTNLMLDFVRIT